MTPKRRRKCLASRTLPLFTFVLAAPCTREYMSGTRSNSRHKLCTAMMRMAIESKHSDFSFYSWAPVDGFPTETSDGKWVVKTSRGSITTTKVVLCTNAHTQNFFPKGHLLHNQ